MDSFIHYPSGYPSDLLRITDFTDETDEMDENYVTHVAYYYNLKNFVKLPNRGK